MLRTSEVRVDQHKVYVDTVALERICHFVMENLWDLCQQYSLVWRRQIFPSFTLVMSRTRAGAADSWMQLMGLRLSAVCLEAAEFFGRLQSVRFEERMECVCRHSQWEWRHIKLSAMIDPRLQEVERRFRPIIFDAIPRPMQKFRNEHWFSTFMGGGRRFRADVEQTVMRVQCAVQPSPFSANQNTPDA